MFFDTCVSTVIRTFVMTFVDLFFKKLTGGM